MMPLILFNTMMDTYGKTIASGRYEEGDKDAIREMISYIKEFEPDSKMSNDLNSIILALNQNALTDFNSWLGNVSGNTDKDVYATADKESQIIAQDYLQKQEQEALPEINMEDVVNTAQQVLDNNPFNFKNCLEIPAQEASENASEKVKDGIKTNMSTGVTAKLPMTLYGNYSMTGVLSPAEQKEAGKPSAKAEAKNVIKAIKAEPYAAGGIATSHRMDPLIPLICGIRQEGCLGLRTIRNVQNLFLRYWQNYPEPWTRERALRWRVLPAIRSMSPIHLILQYRETQMQQWLIKR